MMLEEMACLGRIGARESLLKNVAVEPLMMVSGVWR